MHIDLNYYIFKKYNIRHFVVKPIYTDEFCRSTCTPTRCKRYPSRIRMSFFVGSVDSLVVNDCKWNLRLLKTYILEPLFALFCNIYFSVDLTFFLDQRLKFQNIIFFVLSEWFQIREHKRILGGRMYRYVHRSCFVCIFDNFFGRIIFSACFRLRAYFP